MYKELPFDTLVGQTLVSVENNGDCVNFTNDKGEKFSLYHQQDCCEWVRVEDVCGDLDDLVGSPIIQAEESTNTSNPEGVKVSEYQQCFLWTFYRLATAKGFVTIRWYGESNGYYGVSVTFAQMN